MLFVSYEHVPKAEFTLVYNTVITQGANSCPRVIALDLLSSEKKETAAFQFKTAKILII